MSIACVYLGGFAKPKQNEQNAVSVWEGDRSGKPTLINTRVHEKDSLKTRWKRLMDNYHRRYVDQDDIRILGYSIGCHLAAKLAVEQRCMGRIKELFLIAPDPKFCRNPLDELESPSAYEQAQDLWETKDCPGVCLCSALQVASLKAVHILYSEDDPVSLWEGNTEIMKNLIPNWDWCPVTPTTSKPTKNGFHVELKHGDAYNELWVHQQLFANLKLKSAKNSADQSPRTSIEKAVTSIKSKLEDIENVAKQIP